MLLWTEEFKNSIIVRTRDQEILDQLDVQCDVGGIFDPAARRFDHHQKTFTNFFYEEKEAEKKKKAEEEKANDVMNAELYEEILPPQKKERGEKPIIKMSSAGLVYKYFGKEVIKNISKAEYEKDLTEAELDYIFEKVYNSLIREIDAIDNGVNQADDVVYNITTNLSSRIGTMNPPWNAPANAGFSPHAQFKKAMKICEEQFIHTLYGQVQILLPARQNVLEAWNSREAFHSSKEFLWFETTCPWKGHLYEIEKENDLFGLIKFAFYKDGRGMYRVQAVSESSSSFSNRVSLCAGYRGLRNEELCKASDCSDAEFVHAAGFVGGAWSLESVIKMAEASLKEHTQNPEKSLEKKQKLADEK